MWTPHRGKFYISSSCHSNPSTFGKILSFGKRKDSIIANHHSFFQLRKRNPSPTPSAVSSTSSALSNTGDKSKPKFGKTVQTHFENWDILMMMQIFQGAASPQAVKKLLALSEPPKVSRGGGPTKSPSTPPPPIHRKAGGNKALAVVDLTAESSSVTASCPTRKGHHAQSGKNHHFSTWRTAHFLWSTFCTFQRFGHLQWQWLGILWLQ